MSQSPINVSVSINTYTNKPNVGDSNLLFSLLPRALITEGLAYYVPHVDFSPVLSPASLCCQQKFRGDYQMGFRRRWGVY